MKKADQTIVVIGAGAAGLMSAKRLAKKYKVIVLEANDRAGGRIHTVTVPGFSRPIEAGAEFIHGKLPLTLKLLKKGKIDYHALEGNFHRVDAAGFYAQREMIEGWDKLLKRMKKEESDMTLDAFMQKLYPGEEFNDFRKHIRNYAEGFDVADTSRASMKALYNEWSAEDSKIYRVSGGYSQLINYLVADCGKNGVEIITNATVVEINWKKNKVSVQTKDSKQYDGEMCIVTVPLRYLQKSSADSINFNPSIDEYSNAAGEIGYGTVIKVVIEFRNSFWNHYAKDLEFIISDQQIPTWWTQWPDTVPLLTGWKGGPGAENWKEKTDEEILQIALDDLSAIFKMPVSDLQQKIVASKVFNWRNEKYSEGAYSYAWPGSKTAKKILNNPIENTIFFAGEALFSEGSTGTVEAALITGRDVAERVREGG